MRRQREREYGLIKRKEENAQSKDGWKNTQNDGGKEESRKVKDGAYIDGGMADWINGLMQELGKVREMVG